MKLYATIINTAQHHASIDPESNESNPPFWSESWVLRERKKNDSFDFCWPMALYVVANQSFSSYYL
jgi:hypothetical protein